MGRIVTESPVSSTCGDFTPPSMLGLMQNSFGRNRGKLVVDSLLKVRPGCSLMRPRSKLHALVTLKELSSKSFQLAIRRVIQGVHVPYVSGGTRLMRLHERHQLALCACGAGHEDA